VKETPEVPPHSFAREFKSKFSEKQRNNLWSNPGIQVEIVMPMRFM
jgi:hypothetical protein